MAVRCPACGSSVASLSIPDHRELAPGTPRRLIRAVGIAVEEFRAALA